MKTFLRVSALAAAFLLLLLMTSGSFLVIDNPQPADEIIILAGETDHRPARGLQLLSQGYAPRIMIDVPAAAKIYDVETLDIARGYVGKLPQKQAVTICPIVGLSTKAEAHDVLRCLGSQDVRRILLVTSDFHTRRALSTFRQQFPGHDISVAAAFDERQFGRPWWKHRQWAKVNFDEWLRLVWWQSVERWR